MKEVRFRSEANRTARSLREFMLLAKMLAWLA